MVVKGFGKYDEEAGLKSILTVLALRLKKYLATFAATGATMNSVEVVMRNPRSGQILVADHMLNRMDGRRAGKIPYGFEQTILKWMMAKGITPKNARPIDMARAIAWNIHWHGTKHRKRSKKFFEIVDKWKNTDLRKWASDVHMMIATDTLFKQHNIK